LNPLIQQTMSLIKTKVEKDFEAGMDSITSNLEHLTDKQIANLKQSMKFEKKDDVKIKNINKNIKGHET
jgi:hypothetical protein